MNARQIETANVWLQMALSKGESLADCLTALETQYGGEFFQRTAPAGKVEICQEVNGVVTVVHTLQRICH